MSHHQGREHLFLPFLKSLPRFSIIYIRKNKRFKTRFSFVFYNNKSSILFNLGNNNNNRFKMALNPNVYMPPAMAYATRERDRPKPAPVPYLGEYFFASRDT